MKQFNLEEYLKNPSKKVVTRDGSKVRIICTDRKDVDYPIVALIDSRGKEETLSYTKNGYFYYDGRKDVNDLFFAPEKHEGWVNVYRIGGLGCRCIFDSEEKARQCADNGVVATVKIEWEE